ncbi:MAG: S-methyl-5-thioribose-1-phosphate isomerase [Thermoplasmata archaeon]|nr:S-methyl-5-thioribose-1-phosphate isomerase [Thermoplasmata archaeon]
MAGDGSVRVKTPSGYDEYRAVWMEDDSVQMIDQRALPHTFEVFRAETSDEIAFAIKEMVVRGAPSIGATAAYGVAMSAIKGGPVDKAINKILSTRPTANDLFFAVRNVADMIESGMDPQMAADQYVDTIVEQCRAIGEVGAELIPDGGGVLTHCNAGALATVDHGTALAPLRAAAAAGKEFFVFVDETRPRLQGAKLTSWELVNEDIPHAIIADNAAGYYMASGEVQMVIVGADRICANGDFANKIGTYTKALLAKAHEIPFYVAAPVSTFDFDLETGVDIPIEERDTKEVLFMGEYRVAPEGAEALNPAFDVTPAALVTGIITDRGVLTPDEIDPDQLRFY